MHTYTHTHTHTHTLSLSHTHTHSHTQSHKSCLPILQQEQVEKWQITGDNKSIGSTTHWSNTFQQTVPTPFNNECGWQDLYTIMPNPYYHNTLSVCALFAACSLIFLCVFCTLQLDSVSQHADWQVHDMPTDRLTFMTCADCCLTVVLPASGTWRSSPRNSPPSRCAKQCPPAHANHAHNYSLQGKTTNNYI
jgi:hypothetical protein